MLEVAQVLGDRYELRQRLREEGQRQTWLAVDRQTGTGDLVILHLLRVGSLVEAQQQAIEAEAERLLGLQHPRLVCHQAYFYAENGCFCWVELPLPGLSLRNWLAQGREFSPSEVRAIAKQVLQLLNYLHHLTPPLPHKHICPDSVVVTAEMGVYLGNFGTIDGIVNFEQAETSNLNSLLAGDLEALDKLARSLNPKITILPEKRISSRKNWRWLTWLQRFRGIALRRRFPRIKQLLKQLSKPSSTLVSHRDRVRPPRLQLDSSPRELEIVVPQIEQNFLKSVLAMVGAVLLPILGFGVIWFASAIVEIMNKVRDNGAWQSSDGITLVLFGLLIYASWLIIIYLVKYLINYCFQYTNIYLNNRYLRVRSKIWRLAYQKHQWPVSEIQNVQVVRRGAARRAIAIETRNQTRRFGDFSLQDSRRIVEEIQDWLQDKIR
ncbi:MAG: hypothetical protein HC890_04200 [Chloroflexaceae bacterium]|nr:hypothetical protein [Chloroflexaceae bacterium]